MLNLKKSFLISSLIISASLLNGCGGTDAKEDNKEQEQFAIPVTVASISHRSISSNFHTTATLESRKEADIITRVTGIIEQLSIEEGDYVKKGQLLAKIDPRRYQLALNKADAELAGIKQELQRLSTMVSRKLVSAQAADKLKYQHQAAMAARELAALDLQDSQIIAPISGYISHRFVKQGHFTQGYQKLFHIVDQTSLQAIVYLPEHQLSNIKLNQQATLSFSARKNSKHHATIRSISPIIDSRSGTFKVILDLDNTQKELKPGMFAQIALTFDTHHNALTVPSDAIITLDQQSKIYVVRDSKAIEVLVDKGFVQDHQTEISGEVKAGDAIVINGQHNLKSDVIVEVINSTNELELEHDADAAQKSAIVKAH